MESLVRKSQSLQNKTTANGCTEQEALHAAQKVAELLDKYGLSVEQLKRIRLKMSAIPVLSI